MRIPTAARSALVLACGCVGVARAETAAAKAAELTPIVPSPQNALRPAFQLYSEVDLPIMGMGLVFAGARL